MGRRILRFDYAVLAHPAFGNRSFFPVPAQQVVFVDRGTLPVFVWASYLGVAIAVKRKEQLRVLMLMDTLEKHFPRLVKVCYVVSELSFAVFCVLVFYYSINMLENMTRFKQVSASLEINVMYAYLIIPISMAVTTFRVLQGLYRDFRNHTLHFQGRGD